MPTVVLHDDDMQSWKMPRVIGVETGADNYASGSKTERMLQSPWEKRLDHCQNYASTSIQRELGKLTLSEDENNNTHARSSILAAAVFVVLYHIYQHMFIAHIHD